MPSSHTLTKKKNWSNLRPPPQLLPPTKTNKQQVHPGYGFLSENKLFSRAVEEVGAVFLGPTEYSIDAMGDKITSKKIALKAGVGALSCSCLCCAFWWRWWCAVVVVETLSFPVPILNP